MDSRAGRVALLAAGAAALAGLAGCAGASPTADLSDHATSHPPAPVGPGAVAASCVGPVLTATPTVARPGQSVHVTGSWFHTGCADAWANGSLVETQRPLTGLAVRLEQAGSAWVLTREVSATTGEGLLDLRVTLPTALRSGAATLRVVGPGTGTEGPSVTLTVARPARSGRAAPGGGSS